MNRHVTVELNDRELGQVEAAAREKHLDPEHMTAKQLVEILGETTSAAAAIVQATGAMVATLVAEFGQGPGAKGRIIRGAGWRKGQTVSVLSARDIKRVARIVADQAFVIKLASPKSEPVTGGAAREKRLKAAMSVHGMWRGKEDKPQDGLEYQREVRAEWQ